MTTPKWQRFYGRDSLKRTLLAWQGSRLDLCCLTVCLFSTSMLQFTALSQTGTQTHTPTITVSTNLALLDVFSTKTTELAITGKIDFELQVDGYKTPITTFAHGLDNSARPVQLWLLVQCSMPEWHSHASDFLINKKPALRSALDMLPSGTTVGVAHWCDNGASLVDARPTTNVDQVMFALDKALAPVTKGLTSREGELALQATFQIIDYYARQSTPVRLPIVVAIHEDITAAPTKEVDRVLGDVVASSVTSFLITNHDALGDHVSIKAPNGLISAQSETWQILHLVATTSGGTAFLVRHDDYASIISSIVTMAANRVELGFIPIAVDNRWHSIKVICHHIGPATINIPLTYKSQVFVGTRTGKP